MTTPVRSLPTTPRVSPVSLTGTEHEPPSIVPWFVMTNSLTPRQDLSQQVSPIRTAVDLVERERGGVRLFVNIPGLSEE